MHGPKRATADLVAELTRDGDPLPRVGGHWIACDGAGRPRVVLRSVELRLGPFDSVDEAFAFDEGEDDRTLDELEGQPPALLAADLRRARGGRGRRSTRSCSSASRWSGRPSWPTSERVAAGQSSDRRLPASSQPRNASRLRVDSPREVRHSHSLRIAEPKPSSRMVLNDSSA